MKYILVVRGDGGPLLPKLDSKSIGGKQSVATSIDLIRYINTQFPDQFITGVAFNPYNPMPFELNRIKQKIDAGAKYVVTQPIIGKDENADKLKGFNIDVVVEAWMSKNIALLYKSVGKEKDEKSDKYDPVENLKALHGSYPDCSPPRSTPDRENPRLLRRGRRELYEIEKILTGGAKHCRKAEPPPFRARSFTNTL